MASLVIDSNGHAAVYVTLIDGRRRPVRLGKVGEQRAERIRGHITKLEAARLKGVEPDAATATKAWIAVSGASFARGWRRSSCARPAMLPP